jgi:alkylhydroperoxidase family enzyme
MPPYPTEDKKRTAQRDLVDRVLTGDGSASPDQRICAFNNTALPEPLHALLDKVATKPTHVTEADFAATRASGFSEDEIFELVICAAVGQANRQYEAGLEALAEAIGDGNDG